MCKAFEEVRNEGKKDAIIEIAKNLIAIGETKYDTIAKATGLTIDKVRQLAEAK